MDFLTDWLTNWLKELLIGGIMGNLEGLFDTVNTQVGEISAQVGTTPAAWHAGVFSLIRQLSETVILPIAGMVLTFVATYELIQMLLEKNNMHEVDVANLYKLLTPEQIAAEERRWLFDAPIAELAEVKGVSIDEAVKMRTDAVLQEAVVPITVSVRPIEPQGKLIGFASVNFGGVVIDDFKVVDGKNGIFLGAPSKPDPASRTGYRATVRIPDRATQERINAAGVEAYHAAVEQLVARAQALRPAPIKEQMAEAAKQAGKENAARPAPTKAKEARNDR